MSEIQYLCGNQTDDTTQSLPIFEGEESRALDATDCNGIGGGHQGERWERGQARVIRSHVRWPTSEYQDMHHLEGWRVTIVD